MCPRLLWIPIGGKGLPAPLTSMWRPWEDVVIDLSSAVQASSVAGDKGQTLQSELRTTPIRSIEMTKARLINRLEVHAEGVVEGDWLVEKTVFASNQTKTIMLPQYLKTPVSSFVPVTSSTSRTSDSGCSLDVPTALTPWSPT